MSTVAVSVVKWARVVLMHLPQIISVAHNLFALWCSMRGTRQENDAVLRAMKLLNRHRDDIDRLLQNPDEKRALLEGLTILMNRINERDASQGHLSGGDCGASFKPSKKGGNWRECDVCCSTYNLGVRRPTILICGHTFCRSCLEEVSRRGPLLCPTCRTRETRSLTALPPNTVLLSALGDDDQGEDSCCSGGGSASSSNSGSSSCSNSSSSYNSSSSCCSNSSSSDGCNGMPLSFEQQIEYAIFLSQQQAESHGTAYVEASWREVEEAEDERLARALQDSEIYEASRLCFQRQVQAATGGLNPPDKADKECGACAGSQAEPSSPPFSQEEDEEASLRLAIQLHQQEMESSQSLCGNSCGGGSCANGGSSSCDGGWMRELFGPAYCRAAEEGGERVQEEKQVEERSDKGEEEEDNRDEENAVPCSMNQEEERKDSKDEDECASKCNEDDCCTKEGEEECSRLVKAEEELLIQMAIQLSLQQQEASQPPALTARE